MLLMREDVLARLPLVVVLNDDITDRRVGVD